MNATKIQSRNSASFYRSVCVIQLNRTTPAVGHVFYLISVAAIGSRPKPQVYFLPVRLGGWGAHANKRPNIISQ